MDLLLDTQILILLEEDKSLLPKKVLEVIKQHDVIVFSKASIWEMAIKISIKKLYLNRSLEDIVNGFIKDYQFSLLDISLLHIYKIRELHTHHRDPFDRLLISQAMVENLSIISSDDMFDAYPIQRIWK